MKKVIKYVFLGWCGLMALDYAFTQGPGYGAGLVIALVIYYFYQKKKNNQN